MKGNALKKFIQHEEILQREIGCYEEIKKAVLELLRQKGIAPNTAEDILNHLINYYRLEWGNFLL